MIKDIPPHNKNKAKKCPLSPTLSGGQLSKKKKKSHHTEKEEAKIFLFAGDTVLCLENPKESTNSNY